MPTDLNDEIGRDCLDQAGERLEQLGEQPTAFEKDGDMAKATS